MARMASTIAIVMNMNESERESGKAALLTPVFGIWISPSRRQKRRHKRDGQRRSGDLVSPDVLPGAASRKCQRANQTSALFDRPIDDARFNDVRRRSVQVSGTKGR